MEQTLLRIRTMELYFDALSMAASREPRFLQQDDILQLMLKRLADYYENGQWLQDYALDEQSLLPRELKRGVLSEDGVYNLLQQLRA